MKNNRREFIKHGVSALGAVGALPLIHNYAAGEEVGKKPYTGPNVIIIRFGGGVRRRETLEAEHTYSPYFLHELTKRGVLYPVMDISQIKDINTSHGEGTLNILTGKYENYQDVKNQFLKSRFEAGVPTVFEQLRKYYDVPEHQTLIINGEDRTDEEFYTFSNHHLFGVNFRSNVLSLYRFKTYLLRRQIEEGKWEGNELEKKREDLQKLESLDYRVGDNRPPDPHIQSFWENWRQFYGESGFVNPRGDRLLTELALRALKQLRPKMMMVNYNDPDYVHWGNPAHYFIGISIIDQGMRQIVEAVDADEEYRDNTVFVIVPDCGRDSNRMMSVPFQHHFNSKSSHEIFALVMGPGISKGVIVDKAVDQCSIAATIGAVMNYSPDYVEAPALEEAFA